MKDIGPGFKKVLWVWLVGLVALLIVYGVILWPQQKQLFALKQQVRESNQRLERLQQAQSSGFQQRIRRELQALQQQYDALCFEPGDLSRLDFRIHDLASQCRVNKFSSQNAQGKEDKYFTNLTLTDQRKLEVVVDTDFSSFLRLINALERNKPALFIHEMVLSNSFFSEVEELPTGKIEFSALYAKKQ